jgi:hypothetical protein
MPITTPGGLLPLYRGDDEHFSHVLEHLFRPALEKCDLQALPPSTKGAQLIHADIVSKIAQSDLVLCDMSTLNPNVFFELGVRTSLNRPACLVRDDKTPLIPFDTNIINSHIYKSELAPWCLEAEVDGLVRYIKDTMEKTADMNPMWKYFGLTATARIYEGKGGVEEKVDMILHVLAEERFVPAAPTQKIWRDLISQVVLGVLAWHGFQEYSMSYGAGDDHLTVILHKAVDDLERDEISTQINLRLSRLGVAVPHVVIKHR